ncbi:MAG: triple tyrosine motif-containing protein [bacterium]
MYRKRNYLWLNVFIISLLVGCGGGDKNPLAPDPYSDNNPPIITNISAASGREGTTAVITWLTNESSTSEVEYGLSLNYGLTTREVGSYSNPVISHRVCLTNLVSAAQIGNSQRAPLASLSVNTDTTDTGGNQNRLTYHYRVKSRDMAGNLAVSGDYTFQTLSLLPPYPQTYIEAGPDKITSLKKAAFRWRATDDVTPAENLLYAYFLEGYDQGYSPYTNSTEKTYADLSSGQYTFYVRAKDEDGNVDPDPAQWSFTIVGDEAFPETTITEGPKGITPQTTITFTWTGSDNNTAAKDLVYAYFLEGKETGYSSFSSQTTKTYTDLPLGNYAFRVKAKDKDGYEDTTPAERSFTVKEPGGEPETTIVDGPNGVITQTNSVTFTWTGEDDKTPASALTYAYRLSGYETTDSPFSSKTSVSYHNLPRGAYTFYVIAKDGDGLEDPTPAKRSFSIDFTPQDTTPPETTITEGPSGAITTTQATFKWTGTDDITPVADLKYRYMLKGVDDDYSSISSDLLKTYQKLPLGSYTFKVKAVDKAGHEDATPAERSFTIGEASTKLGMSLKPSVTQISVGESFTLDVWINNVSNLIGAAFAIEFESAILEVDDVTLKSSSLFLGKDVVDIYTDDGQGRLEAGVSQQGTSSGGKSGSGVLATIKFVGKKSGQSYLSLVKEKLELKNAASATIDTSDIELSRTLIRVE